MKLSPSITGDKFTWSEHADANHLALALPATELDSEDQSLSIFSYNASLIKSSFTGARGVGGTDGGHAPCG